MSKPEQLPLAFEHRVALGVEDFLVAPGNRTAVDWIDRWPDWPFTALIVVGPAGSGKTHLASLWCAQSRAERIDLAQGIERAAEVARSGRPALIDDCDRALSGPDAERALLGLYNLIRAAGGQMLLTADRPPVEWGLALPDLKSRLNSAMVAIIGPPDDELLAAVAVKLFADRQLSVGEGVVQAMLSRGERSFAGVARTVEALDRAALAAKRPITSALTREVLAELDAES
jgi:chromosomal replication initiation ATPase DnaA